MNAEDDEILETYIEESREHLADIEGNLLSIEERGADIDEALVNKVFRAAHSIKGGAGFLGLEKIKGLSHAIENVLSLVRSRELVPSPGAVNILLVAFDRLRELINHVHQSNEADIAEFVGSLTALASSSLPRAQKASIQTLVDIAGPSGLPILRVPEFDLTRARQAGEAVYLIEYDLIHDVQRLHKSPFDLLKLLLRTGTLIDSVIDITAVGDLDEEPSNQLPYFALLATRLTPALLAERLELAAQHIRLAGAASPAPAQPSSAPPAMRASSLPASAMPAPASAAASAAPPTLPASVEPAVPHEAAQLSAATPPGAAAAANAETTLRVNITLLESLMNIAGELVLSRNQLLEALSANDQRTLTACSQKINLITSELQETVMLTRMQPIKNIFNKFPRVVRDLARELGKEVNLKIYGNEIEMDRTIIEGLSDPLTHLVRNSVDHGVELPEERRLAGKPAMGTVELRAYHEAGQVNIEIRDDGKGIDPHQVAAAAQRKGLITAEQVRTMSEKEMIFLIFLPGLSTAARVTDVSGRGVGMDVVKTNLDKLGGQIDITSELGQGSTIRIKLPLTLAIIPSLLVSVGSERFAIPQTNVEELIRIPADKVKERIEVVGDAEVLILRGKLIPIVQLANVLGLRRTYTDDDSGEVLPERRAIADRRSPRLAIDESAGLRSAVPDERRQRPDRRQSARSDLNVVIVSTGAFQYGLIVDALHDSIEIVVKPLGRHLKHLREYVGATIMGNGRLALILDVDGVARVAELSYMTGTTRAAELQKQAEEQQREAQYFLVFRNAPEEQCAVPLELVERVERIKASDVERVSGTRVLQYRGATLPLFTLGEATGVLPLPPDEAPVVIIFKLAGREIGLLAATPVDCFERHLEIDQTTLKGRGIVGSAIIEGRTTLIFDIYEVVETLHPDWFAGQRKAGADAAAGDAVLLAEDSDFFRAQVKRFIEAGGRRVIAASDGQEAWELLQWHAEHVKLVVTDIEMPRMDGYRLTRRLKADKRFAHLKVIALTSLCSDEDIQRGKDAGIDDYQVKLDREKLVASINNFLGGAAPALGAGAPTGTA